MKAEFAEDSAVTLVTAMHRAFLILMVGPEMAGADAREAANLVHMGLLTPQEAAHGHQVRGLIYPMDPFALAVVMGSTMTAESISPTKMAKAWEDVTKLRAASLSRWISRVNYRLHRRIRFGTPSLVTRYTAPAWMTPQEAGAWLSARTRAANYITNIGDDARVETRALAREAVANGDDWATFTTTLEGQFGAWSRDWQRVARTELQGAYNEGVVAAGIAEFGDTARVARVPERDACEECLRVFLEDGKPRIWPVRDLIANGNNVGVRPSSAWVASIWPVHPNCRCDTVTVPPGFEFSDSWDLIPVSEAA